MTDVYLAIVHYPVRDKVGDTVTTAITNIDVHDLSRSARTYDLKANFIVSPVDAQRLLVNRILSHWLEGAGGKRIPDRAEALSICRPVATVNEAIDAIEAETGLRPWLVATAARAKAGQAIGWEELRTAMRESEEPVLILVDTGHGLAHSLLEESRYVAPPIRPGVYNHLSVRAATGIILDRLFGDTGL